MEANGPVPERHVTLTRPEVAELPQPHEPWRNVTSPPPTALVPSLACAHATQGTDPPRLRPGVWAYWLWPAFHEPAHGPGRLPCTGDDEGGWSYKIDAREWNCTSMGWHIGRYGFSGI
jgi:hypothetical protein